MNDAGAVPPAPSASPGGALSAGLPVAHGLALWAGLALMGLALYARALGGPFFGDDLLYTLRNPWVAEPDPAKLVAILDPFGAPARYVTNYAPVHLLAHTVLLRAFGEWMPGHHAANVAVHAAGALLFGLWLAQRALPRALAAAGALLFFVHPVNVEAVAWPSQLKTTLSFALCMAALSSLGQRPALASLAFVAGLLTKATAAIALPVGALALYLDAPAIRPEERWARARTLGAWTLVFVAFAVSQGLAFRGANAAVAPLAEEPLLRAASSAAIAGRYLWMALTSLGLSTYHEPAGVRSLADPRLWLSLAAIAAIGWRAFAALRARTSECLFWAFAIGSFVPVSQLFPFLYPMADRYLYFMLPGLLGAALAIAAPWSSGVAASPRGRAGALALLGIVLVLFGARTHARAAVWSEPQRILADGARRYPDGRIAHATRARESVAQGRIDEGARSLRAAIDRGFEGLEQLLIDPVYRAHRGDPRLEPLLHELAALWVTRFDARDDLTQLEWRQKARAELVLGDVVAARESFRSALRRGGPHDDAIRSELRSLVRSVNAARSGPAARPSAPDRTR